MADGKSNEFNAERTLDTAQGSYTVVALDALKEQGYDIDKLPYSIKVLLESCLRNLDGNVFTAEHVKTLAGYDATKVEPVEIPFMPGRVVLQDFTGVPAVVDLAALRSAMARMGGDVEKVNPQVPCDLVIDHSVQVDAYAQNDAVALNSAKEFERNNERYEFLKWGQNAFENFRVVPPGNGIVHQVNLEYLAPVVLSRESDGKTYAFPDSLVGTDSHTTMINGLGVLGWGVGGIEAEAVMLGQPIYMLVPEVIGFRLSGELPKGTTATDLVLKVTEELRAAGVVGKFVEFFGPGLASMTLPNRATLANMAPEYGATMGFFPIDEQTIKYMRLSGRDEKHCEHVEAYAKLQGLWRDDEREVTYTRVLEFDMGSVVPALSGPKRPQDRVTLAAMQQTWNKTLAETFGHDSAVSAEAKELDGQSFELRDGAVVIAAITSCTNTSNPSVMMAAGLVAKKAQAKGLTKKPWVKTSLAPGSRVVSDYLDAAELTEPLKALGFYTVGYGCTTCIGNSGPLPAPVKEAIVAKDLVVCSVLSGNRNFEGRIHANIKANYLASPPLVVAYAIAGTTDIDLGNASLGKDQEGKDVFLADIWPSEEEVQAALDRCVTREQFVNRYSAVFEGSAEWQGVNAGTDPVYGWKDSSTYIQEPPFFVGMDKETSPIQPIKGAQVLARLAHSVTTDHISPAGAIAPDSPAGKFLLGHQVPHGMFNSFGSRRGNDRVMTRGTFGNIRIRNELAPGTEGGFTTYLGPDASAPLPEGQIYDCELDPKKGEVCTIYEAAVKYQKHGIPLVVLGGKDYGMGSSRDWAAKGTYLLGVRAVIVESYERIHRSNLVGMGVLPLEFKDGATRDSLGLTGYEHFDIAIDDKVKALQDIGVTATREDGSTVSFSTRCRLDTPVEVEYYRNGGILHTVLRRMASAS